MFPRSIQWRLQLWHGLTLVLVLAGFGFTVFRLHRATEIGQMDRELDQRLNQLVRTLREQGPPTRPRPQNPESGPSSSQTTPVGFRLPPEREEMFGTEAGFYYVVWRRDGRLLGHSTNAAESVPLPTPTHAERSGRTRDQFRESFHFTPRGECLLVGRSTEPEQVGGRRFAIRLVSLGAGVLALGLVGGWWMARRALRPIEDISATAARISSGNLAERIETADTEDELGRLAGVLNATFARLDAAFARQRQFTADASHELRTPISVVLNQAQSALARERSSSEYREALAACQRAAQRMRQLTESLLTLARLDAANAPPKREQFDLGTITAECIELVKTLAASRQIVIQAELAQVKCLGDPESLRLVATNLLNNAIQYNREAGRVLVTVRADQGWAVLSVTDEGPGVQPESLDKIFQRFHREDASRNRHTGGVGLGLAIAKSCMEASGGTITATNASPFGLCVTARIPGV